MMSLPHPKAPFQVPALTDEEEAEALRAAMSGDWQEDADLEGHPAFADDEDDLDDPAPAMDAKPKARRRK